MELDDTHIRQMKENQQQQEYYDKNSEEEYEPETNQVEKAASKVINEDQNNS